MQDASPRKCAAAYDNGDFICILPMSGYRSMGVDPQGNEPLLPPNAADVALGEAVRDALHHSRFLTAAEVEAFLNGGVSQQKYDRWVADVMNRCGYNNRRRMFRDMKRCDVSWQNDCIAIRPNCHERLEGWSRRKTDGIVDMTVASTGTAEAIGAALREAFARCM